MNTGTYVVKKILNYSKITIRLLSIFMMDYIEFFVNAPYNYQLWWALNNYVSSVRSRLIKSVSDRSIFFAFLLLKMWWMKMKCSLKVVIKTIAICAAPQDWLVKQSLAMQWNKPNHKIWNFNVHILLIYKLK